MKSINLTLCQTFGELLSYPNERIKSSTSNCGRTLTQSDPCAAAALAGFIDFIERQNLPQIEEVFTSTFDLQALSYPYVGYQLCGESQARTMFLMKLQELYRTQKFSCGTELPDHLSVMLRFIGSVDDPQGNTEIIVDALLPALEKIIQGIEKQDHPYRNLLNALQIYLTNRVETELPETERQEELSHG